MPVRHACEQRGVEPLGPDREAFRVAAGTEIPTLAGEREQVLVGTSVTPDAGEAVLENAARKELGRDLADDGAPWAVRAREPPVADRPQAVEMILHQPKQRGRLWASRLVDAEGLRRRGCRRVCHVPKRAPRSWRAEHTGDRPGSCHHGVASQAVLPQPAVRLTASTASRGNTRGNTALVLTATTAGWTAVGRSEQLLCDGEHVGRTLAPPALARHLCPPRAPRPPPPRSPCTPPSS